MSGDERNKRDSMSTSESKRYVLRDVLDDIPLQSEESGEDVSITCVELWSGNLYIGTSASEILHLVSIPGESESDPPQFILATRLQPSGFANAANIPTLGVQQILILPGALKACVLCNGTASFYTLPELSPAFAGKREVAGVQWVGGIDENGGRDNPDGTVIMIATTRRINQVLVGERFRPSKNNIEFPGCLRSSRRDTIACVADEKSYALLEIEQQLRIPLFPVSPFLEVDEAQNHNVTSIKAGGSHARSTSLGNFLPNPTEPSIASGLQRLKPPALGERSTSPAQDGGNSRPSSRPRSSTAMASPTMPTKPVTLHKKLKPHILSPSPNEFMLMTGTTHADPGVGMFVNLDGDPSRGTLEFERYPEAVLAYAFPDPANPTDQPQDAQLILALLDRNVTGHTDLGIQIKGISDESSHDDTWLELPGTTNDSVASRAGLHNALDVHSHVFQEVADLLRAVRYRLSQSSGSNLDVDSNSQTRSSIEQLEQERALFESQPRVPASPTVEYDRERNLEEAKFVQRFGHAATSVLVWSENRLWHLLPNPLLLQLESGLLKTVVVQNNTYDFTHLNVTQVLSFLGSVREREPENETDFLGIKYVRQKASLMLFQHLLTGLHDNPNLKTACSLVESALHEGELDPRLPLSLVQPLAQEVVQGSTGIWIHQGIVNCLREFQSPVRDFSGAPNEFWMMIRHYLSTWQEKRGFGSIDDRTIFDTCDAALLHLLLHLDSKPGKYDSAQAPACAKLENVVDHWKGDFDRAILLLEQYKRLFILSRLYQSKKSAKDVLQTWKRICEGEENFDQYISTETVLNQMRRYLTVIRDRTLVQEYAMWLAQRSPDLAVQVLSDENSRIKFDAAEVVAMLKTHAPGSVQLFLEHLVFAKNLDQYADDLVGYYLESVISVLEESEQARQSLAESYTTYRALSSPKPTYFNFITENAPPEPWWQSRLRLLQLLGSGGYATTAGPSKTLTYSIEKVLDRLSPFSEYLVSESIILDARQGRHKEALRLLVHGLGDYDTAVRYCYFGGPSSPSTTIDVSMLPPLEQQTEQFRFLFQEFLKIGDIEDRLERTSHLLGTFATWFDPLEVLSQIPDSWSIAQLSEFLVRTFRAATTERNQAVIIKALSAAQNLQKQAEFIEVCEKLGARLDTGGDDASRGDDEMVVS